MLAGTAEAAQFAAALSSCEGIDVVASLAGRTSAPAALPCPVRVGGFGGIDGLVDELRSTNVDALVDATHPFARQMSAHAEAASVITGVPLLRLVRPPWIPGPDERWHEVDDLEAAAARVDALGARRVLLTIGRQELEPFTALSGVHLVVRSVDPPSNDIEGATVVLGRGPFTIEDEAGVLAEHAIDALVTRNSGGPRAKLDAARDSGVAVVVVRRPPAGGPSVTTVDAAVAWVRDRQAERATKGQSTQ